MPSTVVEEFIIIIAVVIIGLVLFGFITSFFIPHEVFSIAQQQANSLSSSSSISVGPLLVSSSTKSGSTVIEVYNPAVSGNVELFVFPEPSYLQQAVGVITPTTTPSFSVYLPNGTKAKTMTINTPIYDINGRILYGSQVTVYVVPFNTPVTVVVNNVPNSNYILVVWVLYNSNGYWFRIGYSFTGVPSS